MNQSLIHIALVLRDYDEAIAFYCHKLHFKLVEDSYQPEQDKCWVVVAPPARWMGVPVFKPPTTRTRPSSIPERSIVTSYLQAT